MQPCPLASFSFPRTGTPDGDSAAHTPRHRYDRAIVHTRAAGTGASAIKGAQIALLLIDTTQSEPIEDYAQRVFETWKLGRKGVDNGLLIVVARADHRLRIHVGYGLEDQIPDVAAKVVSRDIMIPAIREGHYAEGLMRGIDALQESIIPVMATPTARPAGQGSLYGTLVIASLLIMLYVPFLTTRMRRGQWLTSSASVGDVLLAAGAAMLVPLINALLYPDATTLPLMCLLPVMSGSIRFLIVLPEKRVIHMLRTPAPTAFPYGKPSASRTASSQARTHHRHEPTSYDDERHTARSYEPSSSYSTESSVDNSSDIDIGGGDSGGGGVTDNW